MAATTKFHFTFGTSEEPRSIVPTTVRSKYRPAEVQRRVGSFPDSHRSFAGPPSLEYSYAKAPPTLRRLCDGSLKRACPLSIGKEGVVEDLTRRHHQNFHRRNAAEVQRPGRPPSVYARVIPSGSSPFASIAPLTVPLCLRPDRGPFVRTSSRPERRRRPESRIQIARPVLSVMVW